MIKLCLRRFCNSESRPSDVVRCIMVVKCLCNQPVASTAACDTSSAPRSNGLNLGEVSAKAAVPVAAGGGARTGTGEVLRGEGPEASKAAGLQQE